MARSPLRKAALHVGRLPWLAPRRAAALALAWTTLAPPPVANAARSCEPWYAEIAGVQGRVDVLPVGTKSWLALDRSDQVCVGDLVRTGFFGRTTLRLRDKTTLSIGGVSEVRIGEPRTAGGTLVELLRGIMHVISRDPRELTFETPYGNAGLEGTEFQLVVRDGEPALGVVVVEGQVGVTNATGHVSVPAGNSARAPASGMTTVAADPNPLESLRWAAYYPPLLRGPLPSPDGPPAASRSGDPGFYAARAAARLRYGRLAEAEADLDDADRLGRSATALALRSVIAGTKFDRAAALALAQEARSLAPEAAVPLIALSYAQQEQRDLAGAAQSAELALAAEPDNALALTRRAELALARNDVSEATEAATRAASIDPTLSRAHTVLGFAQLRRLDPEAAIREFEQAIALDQSSPHARLGLGLALTHSGDRAGGRSELELAVPLAPVDAQVRSYMAKMYDTENRHKLTASQVGLAQDIDPLDPTPWLYSALGLLGENRPIEGVRSLDEASKRNDGRAVFRSGFSLDEDLAISANSGVSRLYRDLGLTRIGYLRGVEAVAADPLDHGAHRLVADTFSFEPRHEAARVSELLFAQITQPVNFTPVQPQLGQPTTFIQNSIGPSDLAFSEYGPLFAENGLRFRLSTLGGNRDTTGLDAAIGGVNGRWSYSVARYDYDILGFRENNDFEQSITNALMQVRLSPATSVQAELRSTATEHGDLALSFDPLNYSDLLRIREDTDQLRVGLRHDFTDRHTLLVSSIAQDVGSTTEVGSLSVAAGGDGHSIDVQDIYRAERWWLQSGMSYVQRDARFGIDSPAPLLLDLEQASAYAYATLQPAAAVALTIGASADTVTDGELDENALNPKLGLLWQATERITVRAAAFETLQGSLTTTPANPQPRLEPTQIAGFTQLLLDANGDEARVYGAGIDAELSPRLLAGVEAMQRRIDRTFELPVSPTELLTVPNRTNETSYRAYTHWTPTDRLIVSAEYRYDRLSNTPRAVPAGPPVEPMFGFTNMRIERLPLELRYFGRSGLTAGVRATVVHEDGAFDTALPGQVQQGHDDFWVVDASLGLRLPNRRGVVSLNVDNLLDEEFRFQDIDAQNPSLMPERMAYVRFTVSFD